MHRDNRNAEAKGSWSNGEAEEQTIRAEHLDRRCLGRRWSLWAVDVIQGDSAWRDAG